MVQKHMVESQSFFLNYFMQNLRLPTELRPIKDIKLNEMFKKKDQEQIMVKFF